MPRGSDDARLIAAAAEASATLRKAGRVAVAAIAVADRLDKLEASDGPQGPDLLHLLEGCRRLRAVLRGTE